MVGKSCSDTEAAKWAKECLVHATLSRCTAAHTHTHTHGDRGVTASELRAFLARWSEHFSPLFRWYCNALQTTAIYCNTVDACFCATLVAGFKASLLLVSVYVCDMSVYDMAHPNVRHDSSMCVTCVRHDSYPCVT